MRPDRVETVMLVIAVVAWPFVAALISPQRYEAAYWGVVAMIEGALITVAFWHHHRGGT